MLRQGGVESGFNHVKPEQYEPRLLWVKGKKGKLRVLQCEARDSCGGARDSRWHQVAAQQRDPSLFRQSVPSAQTAAEFAAVDALLAFM